jgi:hypothetical protein
MDQERFFYTLLSTRIKKIQTQNIDVLIYKIRNDLDLVKTYEHEKFKKYKNRIKKITEKVKQHRRCRIQCQHAQICGLHV